MLLALDVGNTNTKLGLYRLNSPQPGSAPIEARAGASMVTGAVETDLPGGSDERPELAAHWRLTTHRAQTVDEYGALFINLFQMKGIDPTQVKHIVISSVVPPVDSTLRQVCETYFQIEPMFVEPGIKTGMPVLVDNPTELGADRLAYSIAAFERYGGPCIVVDFGTATKFEVVSARGEYIGGVIAPGLALSADALFARAAKLSRVDIKRPAKVVGTNTVGHLQSGLYYGYIGLVDGILDRIVAELGFKPRVIASGIMAHLIAADSRYIHEIDDMLTLDGLRLLFERNRSAKPRGRAH
jgi:type III pantothenate kinase